MASYPIIRLNDRTDGIAQKKALAERVEASFIFDEKSHPRAKNGRFAEAAKAVASKAATKAAKEKEQGGRNSTPPVLAKGQSNQEIGTLQEHLNDNYDAKLAVDSKFGPKTEAAVKAFQKLKGLKEDGIVGPETWKALGVESWHYEDESSKKSKSVSRTTRRSKKKSSSAKVTKSKVNDSSKEDSSKKTSSPSKEPKQSIHYILQRGGEREDYKKS